MKLTFYIYRGVHGTLLFTPEKFRGPKEMAATPDDRMDIKITNEINYG